MKKILEEPVVKFLALGFLLYISWLALYEWVIHPYGKIDRFVINNTIEIAMGTLDFLGYQVERTGTKMMGVVGTPGLFIGDSCNGLALFALFSIFIIAFPGKIKAKLWFVPLGIVSIHLLNVLRILALSIIQTYSYEWTEFNHTYTFTILIYGYIFYLWLLWVNKYSGLKFKVGQTS